MAVEPALSSSFIEKYQPVSLYDWIVLVALIFILIFIFLLYQMIRPMHENFEQWKEDEDIKKDLELDLKTLAERNSPPKENEDV